MKVDAGLQIFFVTLKDFIIIDTVNVFHLTQKFRFKCIQNICFLTLKKTMHPYFFCTEKIWVNRLGPICTKKKIFPMLSIPLLYPKESFMSNFKTAMKKRVFNGAPSN